MKKQQTLGAKIKSKEKSLVEKHPWLESSEQDGSISKTFKSIAFGLIPVILTVADMYDVELTRNLLVQLFTAATWLIAIGQFIWGLVRKIYNKSIAKNG